MGFRTRPSSQQDPVCFGWALGSAPTSINFPAELNVNNMNSTVEAQLADNAQVVADIAEVVHSDLYSRKVDVDRRFEEYLDHPILIRHVLWDGTTSDSTISSDLISHIISSAPTAYKKKLANLYYFDAEIKIKVVVQGTAQAMGQLYFVFMPYPLLPTTNGEADVASNLNRATAPNARVVPHIVVDPSKTATYELTLPNINPVGVYCYDPLYSYGSYLFQQRIYNPIGSGTSTAATANVCVYASLGNVRAEGLTNVVMTAPLDFNSEKKGGPLTDVARRATDLADSAGKAFPVLSPFTTAFSAVAKPVGDVLSWLGFAKPPETGPTIVVTNRTCDSYSQVDGKFSAIVLGPSQTTGVSLAPQFGGGSLEDMSIEAICKKEAAFVINSNVSAAGAVGDVVLRFPVSPVLCFKQAANSYAPGPLAFLASAHTYWKGDIEFTFEVIASVFHRATLLIAFDPHPTGATPAMADALMTNENVTVNVSGNTTVRVKVPYRAVKPMLRTGHLFDGSGLPTGNGEINGYVTVYLLNPVKSNGSTDGIKINTFISSSNIKLAAPTPANLAPYLAAGEEVDISFGDSHLDDVGLAYVPDVSHSVKQVASRVTPWLYHWSPAAANKANFVSVANAPFWKDIVGDYFTLVGWIASAYVGTRGSLNWTYEPRILTGAPTWSTHIAAHHIHMKEDALKTGVNPNTDYADAYAWTQPNLGVCSRVDVNAPFIVPWRYLPSAMRYSKYSDNIVFENDYNVDVSCDHNLSVGAGDNMVFCGFVGAPSLTTTYP